MEVTGPRPPGISFCVVCGSEFVAEAGRRLFTDKEECHEKLISDLTTAFGEHKKVTDIATGKSYRVPTRWILENGLRAVDLSQFPLWEDQVR